MPQLEEIIEEQKKCEDEDINEDRLMDNKVKIKKISKKKEKLSENERAQVEVCAKESHTGESNKKISSTEDIVSEKKLAKSEQKITVKSWNKSSPRKPSAKASEKSLTGNLKKSHMKNSDVFLQDCVKISPAKNSDSLLTNSLGESPIVFLKKISEENREEMLTNSSSLITDDLEPEARLITETNVGENSLEIWPKLDNLSSLCLR